MSHRIASVVADPDRLQLTIRWKNGAITTKHLHASVGRREAYAPLREPRVFRRARVVDHGYAVGWPGTEIEFAADALWYEAHREQMPYPDEVMTAEDFKLWMRDQSLSLAAAGRVLGLSRRTVAYYAGGDRSIPRVVFLACMALSGARRRRAAA